MRGFMLLGYKISDKEIIGALKEYLNKYPKAVKERCFKYCVNRFGGMDRDDFNFCWKEIKK